MQKLIELINEHQKEIHPDGIYLPVVAYRDGIFFSDSDCLSWVMDEIHLISKNYGFIKRLLDNDKIDMDLIGQLSNVRGFTDEERLLMLLVIRDSPIDDLISYLK